MTYLSVEEAIKKGKGIVKLRGWVHRERGSNQFKFIVLRDNTNILQCVFKKEKYNNKEWEDIDKLLVESSVELEGKIHEDKRAPTGYEVQVEKFKVIQRSEDFPFNLASKN